jgi:hypothetical protein
MLYAILCYQAEQTVGAWTPDEDAAVMARLMPTTAAVTLRKDRDPPQVLDGPFAATPEQLLGFLVVECGSLDEALAAATALGRANPGGAYEIRPIGTWRPAPRRGPVAA